MDTSTTTLSPSQEKFLEKMLSPSTFRLFTLMKVPMGFLAGMKLKKLDTKHAVTTIPFKRLNKNPFRSIYFAVQSMAAELSTASLALLAIQGYKPSIATIIVGLEAEFHKKATDLTTFTCADGANIFAAVNRCLKTGEPATVTAKTEGRMPDGTLVSTFYFTWSFKQRSK